MSLCTAHIAVRLLLAFSLVCVERAAAQGTAEELFAAGYSYQTGEGGQRDEKRALAYYVQALKLNPELYAALYNGALLYYQRGAYTRAQNYFVKAARAAKNLGEEPSRYEAMARNGLGTCYQKQGKYKAAEKQFDLARRMQKDLVEAHYNYINLLVRDERPDKALAALEMAERLAPSDRYARLEGKLKAKEKKQDMSSDGITGIALFIILMLAYGLYLQRKGLHGTGR